MSLDTPEAEVKLRAKAELVGQALTDYAADVLERAARLPSLDEILAPVRAEFEASGMSEDELADYLEEVKHEARQERRQCRQP